MERLNIPYVMRIKQNTLMRHRNGGQVQAKLLFAHLKVGEYLQMDTKIWGLKVLVTCLKMPTGELLILAATRGIGIDVLETYRDRGPIERTFLCLKSKGFNFERTQLKENDKLSKLMAIAVFALAIAVKTGEILNEEKAIKVKNHGRKIVSIFTYRMDWIKGLLLNPVRKEKDSILKKIMEIHTYNEENISSFQSAT